MPFLWDLDKTDTVPCPPSLGSVAVVDSWSGVPGQYTWVTECRSEIAGVGDGGAS